ncbi:glutathione S-transferase family protein [Colwelliaceae bacterium 6441]
MYQLVTIPGSCSTGIHVLLNKLNIPVEIIPRDQINDYPSLVPTNQVPALKDEEKLFTEGAAIVLYLINKHNVDLNNYGGAALFNQWLMFNYATLHPAYGKLFTLNGVMEEGEKKYEVMHALASRVEDTWKIVDQHLADKSYMTGESPSVIDYLLAIYASWGNYFPQLTIKLGDNVLRLIEEVSQHSVFTKAYQKESVEYRIPQSAR